MSNGVVKPFNDANKKSTQTQPQQHQSVWLAHWKRASCVAAGATIGSTSSGDEELVCVTRNGAVDASERMPEGCSRFSQTTNDLLITETSDGNAFKDNDLARNKGLTGTSKRNISNEFHWLSSSSGQVKQQVIIEPLNRFAGSEVKENIGNFNAFKVVLRRKSSVQTDTMHMNFSEENFKKFSDSGSSSAASIKVFNLEPNGQDRSNVASSAEVIPCISSKLSALPHTSTSLEDAPPVELPKQKSSFCLYDFPNANPCERWVKRLKLSSSTPSAQGTKSLNFTSSQVKISKLFGGIPKNITISSAAALETQVAMGKSNEPNQILEHPKDKEMTSLLSDAWIKRWLYIERETKSVSELQSSKESFLPSIAAMALMGKALAYLQPREHRKIGSCIVWNIKAF